MKVTKLRLRRPTKRAQLLRRSRRRKPPPPAREALLRSGSRTPSDNLRCCKEAQQEWGSVSGNGIPVRAAPEKPSALGTAARRRGGGLCGDWHTWVVCPWEAPIKERAAVPRAVSNAQVPRKPSLIHQCNARTKHGNKPA